MFSTAEDFIRALANFVHEGREIFLPETQYGRRTPSYLLNTLEPYVTPFGIPYVWLVQNRATPHETALVYMLVEATNDAS